MDAQSVMPWVEKFGLPVVLLAGAVGFLAYMLVIRAQAEEREQKAHDRLIDIVEALAQQHSANKRKRKKPRARGRK